ncbi:ubiquinone biosynthesis monooxygenase Coq7 [Sorochytrium milnesiophthora]
MIGSMLRVNQAGEIGANWIYKGQLAVLGRDPKTGPMLQHMLDQEVHHLETFNKLIPEFRARPSALYPVWQAAGFVVGVGSALLGKRAAMACTEAVETVIGNHYNE